jgi:hypothetical protein
MSMETVLFRVFRVNSTGLCCGHSYDALVLLNDHWQTQSPPKICRLGLLHSGKLWGPLEKPWWSLPKTLPKTESLVISPDNISGHLNPSLFDYDPNKSRD